jgi:TolB protein
MEQLTTDPAPEWRPSWSPDGREIAFYGYRTGNREIYVMPAGGGPARQLTRGESQDFFPSWSPDGRWIVFVSLPRVGIWMVAADGSDLRRLTDAGTTPRWSPDGQWIVLSLWNSEKVYRLWKMPSSGGEPIAVTTGPGYGNVQWSRDGRTIYFTGWGEREDNLWAVDPEEKSERPMTDFRSKRGALGLWGLARDGKYLYFTWEEDAGDIWVMDVLEER